MYIVRNELLEQHIRESEVLKKKLSPSQREVFFEKALSLPPEGQAELLKKLQQEARELSDIQKKSVEKYEKKLQKFLKIEKKKIEKTSHSQDEKRAEDLLSQL